MRRRTSGFTLIELTVTLAVVVALSGLLILRVTTWTPRQSLEASARAFGGALRTWRERARFDETSYRVDWREREWRVSTAAGERVAKSALGTGQSFAEPGEILFDLRGVAPARSIRLRHVNGARVEIVVDPVLSDVHYETQ